MNEVKRLIELRTVLRDRKEYVKTCISHHQPDANSENKTSIPDCVLEQELVIINNLISHLQSEIFYISGGSSYDF